MHVSYSKKEITQVLILSLVFAVLFRLGAIYAQSVWSLPAMPTPQGGALPFVSGDTAIGNVINTGPVDQTKQFDPINDRGYLELDALENQANDALKGGNSTLCADQSGFIKICTP